MEKFLVLFRISLAMITFSLTWKSNIPTQMKSAPFSNGAVFECVFESFPGMYCPGRKNLEGDPWTAYLFHKLDRLFRGNGPDIIVWRLFAGRPIIAAVQSLHIKIGFHPRFLTRDNNIELMTADAGDDSICFNFFESLLNKVDAAFLHEPVGNLALEIATYRPVIEGHSYIVHYIADIRLSRLDLGDPLHLAALLPILVQNPDDMTVGSELSGIYTALLTNVKSFNAFLIGEIAAH